MQNNAMENRYNVVSTFVKQVNKSDIDLELHQETLIVTFDMTSHDHSLAFYEITDTLQESFDCVVSVDSHRSLATVVVNVSYDPTMESFIRLYCMDKERLLLQAHNELQEAKRGQSWFGRFLRFVRGKHEF